MVQLLKLFLLKLFAPTIRQKVGGQPTLKCIIKVYKWQHVLGKCHAILKPCFSMKCFCCLMTRNVFSSAPVGNYGELFWYCK